MVIVTIRCSICSVLNKILFLPSPSPSHETISIIVVTPVAATSETPGETPGETPSETPSRTPSETPSKMPSETPIVTPVATVAILEHYP